MRKHCWGQQQSSLLMYSFNGITNQAFLNDQKANTRSGHSYTVGSILEYNFITITSCHKRSQIPINSSFIKIKQMLFGEVMKFVIQQLVPGH